MKNKEDKGTTMEERFEKKFDDVFWAELNTEQYHGDVMIKPFIDFIKEEKQNTLKEVREKLLKIISRVAIMDDNTSLETFAKVYNLIIKDIISYGLSLEKQAKEDKLKSL